MSQSKRVLLVTVDYPPPPGGIQTIVKNLERGLEELGHDVRVLHIDRSDFSWSISDLIPRRRWIYSTDGITSRDYVYMNTVYRRTVDEIESWKPDLVHAMHVKNWPAIAAANERDIPTALSTYALELGNKALSRQAVRDADIVHALTEFTESLVMDVASENTKTSIIPPSIDVDSYQRAADRQNGEGPGPVVTISRFVNRKNIETVIAAWERLDESVKNGRELVVAGEGPQADTLKHLASGLDSVRFPGWVNGGAKRRLLADADVFAMVPRRNGYDVEGFGIVYIEAQAAGTPVVGSKHGGAPEAIDDAGVIVDDESNAEEVANAIQKLIENDDFRENKLANARDRVGDFGIVPIAEQHLNMYEKVL